MDSEIWKPIPDFPGYEVSSHGRVRSYKKMGCLAPIVDVPQKILKPYSSPNGRMHLVLRKKSKGYTVRPPRLVMEAFVGPCPDGLEVCHNDGNPMNNHLDNLRYDTHEENMYDRVEHDCGVRKPERDTEIREKCRSGVSFKELSREYGLSEGHIRSQICKGILTPHRQRKYRDAEAMRYDRANGSTYVEIGEKYGITTTHAQFICQGRYCPEAGGPIAPVKHRNTPID